jgi:hypothetical protein
MKYGKSASFHKTTGCPLYVALVLESRSWMAQSVRDDPFLATESDHALSDVPSTSIIHRDRRICREREIQVNSSR